MVTRTRSLTPSISTSTRSTRNRMTCWRSAGVVVGASHSAGRSRASSRICSTSWRVERGRLRLAEAGVLFLQPPDLLQRLLPPPLQRPLRPAGSPVRPPDTAARSGPPGCGPAPTAVASSRPTPTAPASRRRPRTGSAPRPRAARRPAPGTRRVDRGPGRPAPGDTPRAHPPPRSGTCSGGSASRPA